MIKIDKTNIDKWLFEYFEGGLSSIEKMNVEQFVALNPEFESDFEAWDGARINESQLRKVNLDFQKRIIRKPSIWYKIGTGGLTTLLIGSITGFIFWNSDGITQEEHVSSTQQNALIRHDEDATEFEKTQNELAHSSPTITYIEKTSEQINTTVNTSIKNQFIFPDQIEPIATHKTYSKPEVNIPNRIIYHSPRSHEKKRLSIKDRIKIWQETRGNAPIIIEMESDLF